MYHNETIDKPKGMLGDKMEGRILVIADDLTGALDTGVQLAATGAIVFTTLSEDLELMVNRHTKAIIIHSNTRHCAQAEALRITKNITKAAIEYGFQVIYKKTDSALRGNVGAEIEGTLEGGHCKPVYFIPAFPQIGRMTVGGVQFIDGVPLSESVFAEDPLSPMKESCIQKIISSQSNKTIEIVPCNQNLSEGQFVTEEADIVVFDADREARLAQIADYLKRRKKPIIIAGCAGFASYLPQIAEVAEYDIKLPVVKQKGLIVVSASLNHTNIKQLQHAEANGFDTYSVFEMKGFSKEREFSPQDEDIDHLLSRYDKSKKLLLVANQWEGKENKREKNEELWKRESECISRNIGILVAALFKKKFEGLITVTGGDTLYGVIDGLGIKYLEPYYEIETGVVLSRFKIEEKEHYLIAKSGGLGSKEVFNRIFKSLCE